MLEKVLLLMALYNAVIYVYTLGVIDGITSVINYLLFKVYTPIRVKPFTCLLCTTFWVMFCYLIVDGENILMSILIALALSYLSDFFSNIQMLLKMTLSKIVEFLIKKIN